MRVAVEVHGPRSTPIRRQVQLLRPLLSLPLLMLMLLLLLALTVTVSGVRLSLTRQAAVVRRSLRDGDGGGSREGGKEPTQGLLGRVNELESELVAEQVNGTLGAVEDNSPLDVQVSADTVLDYLSQPEPSACQGRRLFIYPNMPLAYNQLILEACAALTDDSCPGLTRDGLGEELPPLSTGGGGIDGSDGGGSGSSDGALKESRLFERKAWLATFSEALGTVFYARAHRYDCLVSDWRDADVVYVPVLLEAFAWVMDYAMVDRVAGVLTDFLLSQPAYQRHGGADHIIVTGNEIWAITRLDPLGTWGSNMTVLPPFRNVMFVSPESIWWRGNTVSFPYTTGFHPADADELARWQHHAAVSPRPFLVALVCGTRPVGPSKAIRDQLLSQCLARPNECRQLDCTKICPFGFCRHFKGGCTDPRVVALTYLSARFCLQPRGDSYTRRSLIEAIGAGCIPVIFDQDSFGNQYVFHFPGHEKKYMANSSYAVFFEGGEVEAGKINVLDELAKIPDEEVTDMRRKLIAIIPNTVYRDHRRAVQSSKPFKDAFDIGLEGLFRSLQDRVRAKH